MLKISKICESNFGVAVGGAAFVRMLIEGVVNALASQGASYLYRGAYTPPRCSYRPREF